MSVKNYPTGYKLPRHNVLLISCMDLRLLDNIVQFMEHDNLANRYDQFILAGTSIGAFVADSNPTDPDLIHDAKLVSWRNALYQHIDLSIALHDIHDIYVMEHRNCGAYKKFLKDGKGDFDNLPSGDTHEFDAHKKYSVKLIKLIQDYIEKQKETVKDKETLKKYQVHFNIHCFLMDLRGDVVLLESTARNPSVAFSGEEY